MTQPTAYNRGMDFETALPEPATAVLHFAISLAIGLLIGSERERKPGAQAGLRTFALISLLGTICALLAQATESDWILAAGLAGVAAMMIVAHLRRDDDEPGTTTTIATLVCYGLGAMVWFGYPTIAVMLAIATTVLLYFKPELEGFSTAMSRRDWISILRFAVLSLVVLPILPDRGYGPYSALNPFNIWLMVVLISGIGLAGYLALRLVGARHGALLLGLFGGLVSSTATTLVYGRAARENPDAGPLATQVIVLANTALPLRIGLVTLAVAPWIAAEVAAMLAAPLLVGIAGALWFHRHRKGPVEVVTPDVANPTGLRTAVGFGLLYGLVLLAAAWLSDIAGDRGLYAVAAASGMTDLDAITLSTLRLAELESIETRQAVVAIAIALVSNNLFKYVLLAFATERTTLRRAGTVLLAMAAALAVVMARELA
jgi:uncharacterized membrane protein (DUF4010 family)